MRTFVTVNVLGDKMFFIWIIFILILMFLSMYIPDGITTIVNNGLLLKTNNYYFEEMIYAAISIIFIHETISSISKIIKSKKKDRDRYNQAFATFIASIFFIYLVINSSSANIWSIMIDDKEIIYSNIYSEISIPKTNITDITVEKYESRDTRSIFFGITQYIKIKIKSKDLTKEGTDFINISQSQKKSIFGITINSSNNYDNIIEKIDEYKKKYNIPED